MPLIIPFCLLCFISNLPVTVQFNGLRHPIDEQMTCQTVGDRCQRTSDCCSYLTCSLVQEQRRCTPSIGRSVRRDTDDVTIAPYYGRKMNLYPYGTPRLPVHDSYAGKPSKSYHRSKLEWNPCRFHDDCGQGNCCYVHFRFRSRPKSLCRPNRNLKSDRCEPSSNYRSSQDASAWK